MANGDRDRIETGSVVVDGVPVFFRRIPGEGPPVVLVHGVPDHSERWQPFLERMRGPALAFDLPGFGRSGRPDPERFDFSARGQGEFAGQVLEALGVTDHILCVHDWGAVGLIPAQREPSRIKRLCVINAVPLLPGYRWHRTARGWRTPVLGELSTRMFTKRTLALGLRESRGDWSAPPPEFVEMIWEHLDRASFDAILRLYRSAPSDELARLGERLGSIEAPALVAWSTRDRYLPLRFGRAYADALPGAELLELPGLGHWPWLEDPSLVGRIAGFLEHGEQGA